MVLKVCERLQCAHCKGKGHTTQSCDELKEALHRCNSEYEGTSVLILLISLYSVPIVLNCVLLNIHFMICSNSELYWLVSVLLRIFARIPKLGFLGPRPPKF